MVFSAGGEGGTLLSIYVFSSRLSSVRAGGRGKGEGDVTGTDVVTGKSEAPNTKLTPPTIAVGNWL